MSECDWSSDVCSSDLSVETFNLGTGTGVSVLKIINTFVKVTGVDVPYKIVGRRDGDIEKVWGGVEKANKELGWKTERTLEETLDSAWKWQLKLRERGLM